MKNGIKMPGFTAEASLYRTNGKYCHVSTGAFLSSGEVIPQLGWCEFKCQLAFFACGGSCAAWGPAAPLCGGICFAEAVQCFEACDGSSGGGGGVSTCSKTTCPPFGELPCCPGYYCVGGRCQPEGTHPQ